MFTSTMYKLTVTEAATTPGYRPTEVQVVPLDQIGPTLTSLARGKINPVINVERIERKVLDRYAIRENPSQPAILVLKPWGTYTGQRNKINAIKALRTVDPGRPNLKDAKDAVELGLEIFAPWDLTARVAQFIADGLRDSELYADVCIRVDEE